MNKEIARNNIERIIVAVNNVFSMPLLVLKTPPPPPNMPERPEPLFCKRITTIKDTAITNWII